MTEPEPKPVNVRWQCPRGHFVADSSIETTDRENLLGSYFGVVTEWFYHCKACGCDYIDDHGEAPVGTRRRMPARRLDALGILAGLIVALFAGVPAYGLARIAVDSWYSDLALPVKVWVTVLAVVIAVVVAVVVWLVATVRRPE